MFIFRALSIIALAVFIEGQENDAVHGGELQGQTNVLELEENRISNENMMGHIDIQPNAPGPHQAGVDARSMVAVPHQGNYNPPQYPVEVNRVPNQQYPQQVAQKISHLNLQKVQPAGLATSEECADDVNRLCSDKLRLTNLEILSCMTERAQSDDDLVEDCHIYLWEYKLNITKDPQFTRVARAVCKNPLQLFKECQPMDDSDGKLIPCLLSHKNEIDYRPCYNFLLKMGTIIFSDYRTICDFVSDCKVDIEDYGCGRVGGKASEDQNNTRAAHSQGAVIHCLENEIAEGNDVGEKCAKQIVRLAELSSDDFHLDRNLYFACKEDRESLCEEVAAGEGRIYKCLFQHKFDHEMSITCRNALTDRQRLVAKDYKASYTLQMSCQKEIEDLKCKEHPEYHSQGLNDHSDFIGLSGMLLCIEEGRNTGRYIPNTQCESQLAVFRQMLSDDYKMSPEIVKGCQIEIIGHCNEQGIEQNGGTIHCLMALAQNDVKNGKRHQQTLSDRCADAIIHLLKADHAGTDYRMDRALAEACDPVAKTACANHELGDPLILSCLMENIHTKFMVESCRKRLLELQYFITRDFFLDEKFNKKCRADANSLCKEDLSRMNKDEINMPFSLVLSCLYRHIPNVPGEIVDAGYVSDGCAGEVRRVMKHRALDVELNHELEKACIHSLGKYCSQEEVGKGYDLVCLQDHFENITADADLDDDAANCIDQLEQITEIEEAEEGNLDNVLLRACEPDIDRLCSDERDDGEDGEVMQCLIERKLDLSRDCEAGVTHLQLIELQDVKFSYNFMKACKNDISGFCQEKMTKGPTKKNDIIECLSQFHVRSILEKNSPDISEACAAQLTVENFERHDSSMKFNPEIRKACQSDYKQHCKTSKVKGLECLRLHHHEISPKCRKELFKLEQEEAIDPSLDVALMRTCKSAILKYCGDTRSSPEDTLECLIQYKEDLGDKCYEVVQEREREQFSDINLNPELLKACTQDIQHYCKDELTAVDNKDYTKDMHGRVIACLKDVEVQSDEQNQLSQSCERHIRFIMKEEESDYKLDPMLTLSCVDSINSLCRPESVVNVIECLKVMYFQDKLSDNTACMIQVARLLKEGRSDIMADPILHNACHSDIENYCGGIAEGRGRVMACILDVVRTGGSPVTQQCTEAVLQRQQMWDFARKYNFDTFGGLVEVVWASPSKSYLLSTLMMVIFGILIFGVVCGRLTKRVSRQRKHIL